MKRVCCCLLVRFIFLFYCCHHMDCEYVSILSFGQWQNGHLDKIYLAPIYLCHHMDCELMSISPFGQWLNGHICNVSSFISIIVDLFEVLGCTLLLKNSTNLRGNRWHCVNKEKQVHRVKNDQTSVPEMYTHIFYQLSQFSSNTAVISFSASMAILSTEVYVTISLNKSNLEQYSFFVFLLFLFVCEAELLQAFLGFHKLILIYLGLHIDFSYSVCILFAKSPVQHLPQFPSIIRHLYDLHP